MTAYGAFDRSLISALLFWLFPALAGTANSAQQCHPCPDTALAAPGLWNMEADMLTWQTVDQCCQLQDLVGAALNVPEEPSLHDPHHGILLLGDSVEAFTLRAVCSGGDIHLSDRNHSLAAFWACKRGPLVIAVQAMAGVHPVGPWHGNVTGSPEQRLAHVTILTNTTQPYGMQTPLKTWQQLSSEGAVCRVCSLISSSSAASQQLWCTAPSSGTRRASTTMTPKHRPACHCHRRC